MERRGLDLNLRSGGRWGPRVFRLRGNIIHKRQRGSTALRRRGSAELLGGGARRRFLEGVRRGQVQARGGVNRARPRGREERWEPGGII